MMPLARMEKRRQRRAIDYNSKISIEDLKNSSGSKSTSPVRLHQHMASAATHGDFYPNNKSNHLLHYASSMTRPDDFFMPSRAAKPEKKSSVTLVTTEIDHKTSVQAPQHGRNHTQSIHFNSKNLCQANGFMHGWGVMDEATRQPKTKLQKIFALPTSEQPHKKYWDHEVSQVNLRTTGWNSSHLDAKLGLAFAEFQGLSVREKRQIVKKRVGELMKV